MESTWITLLVDDHNSVVAFCLQFRDAETKPDLHPLNPCAILRPQESQPNLSAFSEVIELLLNSAAAQPPQCGLGRPVRCLASGYIRRPSI